MISAGLTRFEHPACASCKVWAPDCMVPVDDKTLALCWLCAHMVTTHEHVIGDNITACSCSEVDIFPPDITELRKLRRVRGEALARGELPPDDRTQTDGVPLYVEQPEYVGRHSKRWASRDVRSAGGTLIGMQLGEGIGPSAIELPRMLSPAEVAERDRGFRGPNRAVTK